jgi:hypothetical protein
MTHQRFDARSLRDGPRLDRRSLSRMLAGVGLFGGLSLADETAAKKRKKPKPCKKGTKRCGKKCVNVATDKTNCGGCGKRCAADEFCGAGTCTPCDVCPACAYQSVQAALDDPQGPASIQLCAGTYSEILTIDRDVMLRGAGDGPAGTVVDAAVRGPAVRVRADRTVIMRDMVITGGSGGGIRNQGDLTLSRCTVAKNQSGEGVFSDAGSRLTLEQCVVSGNAREGIVSREDLRLEGCRITDNKGQGVFCDQSLTAIDTHIEGNTSSSWGAGISCLGALNLTRVTVRGNHSTNGEGGGINFHSTAVIVDSTITDNIANNGGGVRGTASAPSSLSGCTIDKNHANGSGTFATGGGGLFIGGPIAVTGCQITGNDSTHQGGGIVAGDGVTVNDCTIRGNHAATAGGGIFNYGDLTARASTIRDNTAEDAAGIFNNEGASLLLEECTVTGNTANVTGGGMVTKGDVTLDNTTITGNTAEGGADSGGGIFVDSSATVTLLGTSSVTGNTPDDCVGC